jgi:CHAD domain-containing protein
MKLTITSQAPESTKFVGLELWMDRVPNLADKIEPRWHPDDVHDLRVALRRSRAIAQALREVNPAPEWHKLKKGSHALFHALGNLRDAQVARAWIKKLGPTHDPVRKHMFGLFAQLEKKYRELAESALKDFNRKDWRKWKRKLAPKAGFFPPESVVFQRLALGRLNTAFDLYQQARKRRSDVGWHRARIAIKHFRYVVENLLPRRYEQWANDLKRFQNLLGDMHDLDVLRNSLRKQLSKLNRARVAQWMARIAKQRAARFQEFLQRSRAENSPWTIWRGAFHQGHTLVPAAPFPERRTA